MYNKLVTYLQQREASETKCLGRGILEMFALENYRIT